MKKKTKREPLFVYARSAKYVNMMSLTTKEDSCFFSLGITFLRTLLESGFSLEKSLHCFSKSDLIFFSQKSYSFHSKFSLLKNLSLDPMGVPMLL